MSSNHVDLSHDMDKIVPLCGTRERRGNKFYLIQPYNGRLPDYIDCPRCNSMAHYMHQGMSLRRARQVVKGDEMRAAAGEGV